MQNINVFENGIGYLASCLGLYMGSCAYLLLFLCGALYILVKGSDEEKEIFLPGTALLILTVYNPLSPLILDKIFDVSSEYYRLFWIAPVIILVPFVAAKLFDGGRDKKEKGAILAFLIIIGLLSGDFIYKTGIPLAENIYKIPDELIEISELIHEDSEEEYTKAFFEYEYNMEIRQYDPKMLLTIDREEYIYAVNYSYTDEMLNDADTPTNIILAALIRNQEVDETAFKNALCATKTQYVVLTKGNYQADLLRRCGLRLIGDTATHEIYKNDLEEPLGYELVDYSEVEHMFSYRRLK